MNNDGIDDVAVVGQLEDNEHHYFQVQDGANGGQVLINYDLELALANVTYHIFPDLNEDDKADVGFMGINEEGEYELSIQNGDGVSGTLANYILGTNWELAPTIVSLDGNLSDLITYNTEFTAGESVLSELFETDEMTLRCSGNCPEVTKDLVMNSDYALKVELDIEKSDVSYRTEIQEAGFANFDDTFWYSFNIYLPNDYVTDDIWELVAQWHGYPDFDLGETWRNPPLALTTTYGVWTIRNKWDSKENTFESGEKVYDGDDAWDLGEYETGVWVSWVFQVKWSHKEDGILNVWKDGELVVSKNGPNTFNDAIAPYFKAGMYKGWHDSSVLDESNVTKRTLYFDDIIIKTDSSSASALVSLK